MASNGMQMAALAYANKGQAVFPLNGKVPRTKNGFKDASTDKATITEWWRKSPMANIGMPTGKANKIVVLDVDPRNGGTESFYKLNEDYGKLPDTLTQKTGGGGFHYVFQCPDGVSIKNGHIEGYPGLDIKGEGGYIVVPPSRTEGVYKWDKKAKRAPLPDWLLKLITEAQPQLAETIPGTIPSGKRNSILTSLAGSMRRRGASPQAILKAIQEENKRCVDPLPDKELHGIAESIGRYAPETNRDKGAICLSSVKAEEISFLLEPSIILGKTVTVDADPGCGKTYFMQAIAAGLSRGDGVPGLAVSEPGNSLFFVTEDALGDTMKPRFEKLEADCDRIFAVTDIFKFDESGFRKFEQHIQDTQPTLVVIDPITTYLGDNVDAYRDNAVRPILSRLGKIATQQNCAIVIIRHLVKGQKTKAIYAGQNSIAFIASARSGLLLGRDPNNPEYGAAHHIKHNLTRKGDPIGYRIDSDGYFHWTGSSQLTLETILTEEVDSREDEAKLFLETRLSNGPVKAALLYTEAENNDIKKRTLQRAKNALGINVYKGGGFKAPWMWELPTKDATKIATHGTLTEVPQNPNSQPQSRLGNLGTNSNYKYIDNKDLSKTATHGNLNGTLGDNGNLKNHEGSQIPSKPRGTTKNKIENPEKFEL